LAFFLPLTQPEVIAVATVVIDSRRGTVVSRSEVATALDARRRSLRVDTRAKLISSGAPMVQADVALMDVTHDGFRLATTSPLAVNSTFVCALMPNITTRQQPRARVVDCQPQRADGHDVGYVSRFEFEDPDAA
jgi:hypothetical protein